MFNVSKYRDFYKLKNILRKGWLDRKVPQSGIRSESDAEHTFSCMFMAIEIINDKKLDLDRDKVLFMLLCHEVGESEIGDITPFDGITPEQKHDMEAKAVKAFAEKHNLTEIFDVWMEFEERVNKEAKFCYAIDKLDAVVQAKIYSEEIGNPALFAEFYENTKQKVENFEWFNFIFED